MSPKVILFLLLFLPSVSLFAQEICNNGQDDDGDSLVDLNDPDCDCNGVIPLAPSMIPNPSFEDTLCCPSGYDQLACTQGWQSGTNTSSDLFHTCDFFSPTQVGPPTPLPDGDAFVGFINNGTYQEFIGRCLPNELNAGTNYRLKAAVGFGVNLGTAYSGVSPFSFSLYGAPGCVPFPINNAGNGCPTQVSTDWVLLGSVVLTGNAEWVEAIIDFTPAQNIGSIIIGPDCGTASPPAYYFVDNLVLGLTSDFGGVSMTSSGDPCQGTLALTVDPINNPNIQYQWYKDGVALAGEINQSLLVPSGPGGIFQVRVWDGICCDTLQQFIPVGNSVVTVDISGNLEICAGEQSALSGPLGFVTYAWTTPSGNATGAQINASLAGEHILEVTDINGCQVSDTVDFIVNPIPVVQATTQDVRCFGERNGEIQLRSNVGQGPFQYSLDNGAAITTGLFRGLRSGPYAYLVIDAKGCETTGTVNLFQPDLLAIEIDQFQDAACDQNNGAVRLSAMGGTQPYTINWSNDNSNLLERSNLAEGSYGVKLEDANGCVDSIGFDISNDSRPIADFNIPLRDTSAISLSEATIRFENTTQNGFRYQWDFGDGSAVVPSDNPSHTFSMEGIYTITLIAYNRGGDECTDTTSQTIRILDDFHLYFPTAFSPNNDGSNDRYQLKGEGLSQLDCTILDRWGQIVASWTGIDGSWDGTRNGRAVPEGVYTIQVRAITNRGEALERAQSITLIR
ncbi:MAG: gliding motility-associated C-terminal domain-containing protein [Bacteroidota bacterium]